MSNSDSIHVRKRRVFYIPGYDPIHPRRYRELYRTESSKQADISGYSIGQTQKTASGPYGWHVAATIDGAEVAADVDVLLWSDIVRDSMDTSVTATYWQLGRTAWTYITTGTLRRLMWMRKGPVIAALYPVGMLLLQLLLAISFGVMLTGLGKSLLVPYLGIFGHLIALAAGMVLFGAVLDWFRKKDNKFFAYYLMHDYAFSARWGGANPPALEDRMAAFATTIADAMTSDVDEVLIVGHSSGAHLAVSILADLFRAGRVPKGGPAVGFLSLGQVVPMMSFLPKAYRLRADLAYLSVQDGVTWVDVTAPGDGCAFALCDPVAVSGVAVDHKKWPLVISAAFTQSLQPETWNALRWRFFRLHFQYLCAFDRPKDYDYFQITAGPLTLADRYRDRVPSRSRIDVAASKYTSTAP
ncbi:MAG: hypothetical protein KC448_10705 [Yoonia sp.]|nr:hypothetical protein [Yoonia sp.]